MWQKYILLISYTALLFFFSSRKWL